MLDDLITFPAVCVKIGVYWYCSGWRRPTLLIESAARRMDSKSYFACRDLLFRKTSIAFQNPIDDGGRKFIIAGLPSQVMCAYFGCCQGCF
ncbi:hypothetical protein [Roseinatronobacter thiooxidans]|nr:hypothetical protein [Roseinatronobacter thiooxidans]